MNFKPNYTRDDIQKYLEDIGEQALLMDGYEHDPKGWSDMAVL